MARKLIRIDRMPLLPEEEEILERVFAAEQAGRPSRVSPAKLEAMTFRGLVYVVRHPAPALPRPHVTAAGAVQLGVPIGNRA